MPAPALRPRAVTEILDAAFHLYREHFTPLTILAALALFPVVVMTAVFAAGMTAIETSGGEVAATPVFAVVMLVFALLSPLLLAWFLLLQAALQRAVSDAYLGEPVSWSGALRAVRPRFWRVIGASILKGLLLSAPVFAALLVIGIGVAIQQPAIVILVFLALIVVVYLIYMRVALVPATVVLEDNGVGASLRRSWELTAGHARRVFGALALAYLIVIALQLTVMGIVTVVSNFAVGQIAANLASIVTYPIVAGVIVLMYYDLRIRKEGFDLEVMSADLARLPDPSGASAGTADAQLARRIR